MRVSSSGNLLVLLLVLTLFLLPISANQAYAVNCYVTPSECSTDPNFCGSYTGTLQCKVVNAPDASVCEAGPSSNGFAIDDCQVGCCCDSSNPDDKTYQIGATKGVCINTGKTFIPTLSESSCSAQCSSSSSQVYDLTGIVRKNGAIVAGVTVSLANTYFDVTDATGKYEFYNIPSTSGSNTYVLSATSGCTSSQNVQLTSDRTQDIAITCADVVVEGFTTNSAGTIIPNVLITRDLNGEKVTARSGTNGYYKFSVPTNTMVSMNASYLNAGNVCKGTADATIVQSNVSKNIIIECTSYTVNVQVRRDGTQVTDADVHTNTGKSAAYSNGFYALTELYAGQVEVRATKIYSSTVGSDFISTECFAGSNLSLGASSPASQNLNLNFGDNNCCTKTISYSACSGGVMTRTTRFSGSCSKSPESTQLSCDTPLQPCQWNCTWSSCSNGEIYSTGSCSGKISTPNCDMSLPTPFPSLTRQCPGSESCGNGQLDAGETCDYNPLIPSQYAVADSCVQTWADIIHRTNPTADVNADYLFTNNYLNAACRLSDCTCKEPVKVQPPANQCVLTPSNLTSLTADSVQNSDDFRLAWTISNPSCNNMINHYELRICNNDGSLNGCNAGTQYIINTNIARNAFNYTHDGSINPRILENKAYCYNLTAVYDAQAGGYSTSIVQCVASGDNTCMDPDHQDTWCNGNIVESCLANNSIDQKACVDGQSCWYNSNTDTAQCLRRDTCESCNAVFGIYSYMGYEVPTNIPSTQDPRRNYKIFCPSGFYPNPNPQNTGKSLDEYVFGCYLDFSSTTVDKVYSCSAVSTCYDYKSQTACEQDYCGKFTTTGSSDCEWNAYTSDGNGKNIGGKGVCAPKEIVKQDCGLCNDPEYNRLHSSCIQDVCNLYGDCYFDSYSNECWNRREVQCDWYMDEFGCNGASPTVPAKNVFTNANWLNNRNDENLGNIKVGGDNVKSNGSDGARLGICKWVITNPNIGLYECIRDADNSFTPLEDDCRIYSLFWDEECELDVTPPTTKLTPSNTQNGYAIYGLNMNLNNEVEILDDKPWPVLGDDSIYRISMANWSSLRTLYCVNPLNGPVCYPNATIKTTPDDAYIINLEPFNIRRSDHDNVYSFRYSSEDPSRNLETIKTTNFRLDALEPAITMDMDIDPYQISIYQWLSNVSFRLTLGQATFRGAPVAEASLPVSCTFVLNPITPNAALEFEFNDNEGNNMPSRNNPEVGNRLFNTGDSVIASYVALSDGQYEYVYECTDDVGNNQTVKGQITIDGDLRISDPKPVGNVYRSSQIQNGAVDISIKTNADGTCRFSETTADYNQMTRTFAYNAGDQRQHASITIPGGSASRIYKYFVACNLNINGEYNIVPGSDADTPYFSIDDLAPRTSLLFKDPANNYAWKTYAYSEAEIYDNIVIKLNCDDSDPILKMFSGYNMSFGCSDDQFYCIPHGSIDCLDTSEYTRANNGEISLSYQEVNSQDKARYGNTPSIFYYSTDKGGNVENYRIMKLNVRNIRLAPPELTFGPANKTAEVDDETYVNYHAPTITLKYFDETKINIQGFTVLRVDDNSFTSVQMNLINSQTTADHVSFTYSKEFVPKGRYMLIANVTDDDGNKNEYTTYFTVNHTGSAVTLFRPPLGIGTSQAYNIQVKTAVPSDCKYGTQKLSACDYRPNSLDCWFTGNTNYRTTTSSDGLLHEFRYDDGSATDFISTDLMYVVCKIRNSQSTSNDYYSLTSFHYGHLTTGPAIDVNYVLDPLMNDSKYNVIINQEKPWVTVMVNTSQPSVCRIQLDHSSNLLDVDSAFNGEEDTTNYDSYKLSHTYTIDYTGTGFDDGRMRYDFTYNVNCTNLAQLSSSKTAPVIIDIDKTPPDADIISVSQYLTLKEYKVTCDDHCTDTYSFKLVPFGQVCDSNGLGGLVGYDNVVSIVQPSTLCVNVSDVLGRSTLKGFDIQVTPFNKGLMDILNPHEYSAYGGSVVNAYSEKNIFQLIVDTKEFGAQCVHGLSNPLYADMTMEEIFNDLSRVTNQFNVTGRPGSQEGVTIHSVDFRLMSSQKFPEAHIILCKAFDISPGGEPYIAREVFFYWDNSTPTIDVDHAPRIYDWNNRQRTNLTINTDDETMCNITDNSIVPPLARDIDTGSKTVYESYFTNRTYTYNVPSFYYNDFYANADIVLEVVCMNRAKNETTIDNVTIHYEIDKKVDATTNLDTQNVFRTQDAYIEAVTDIISTCSVTVDGQLTYVMDSDDRINHSRTINMAPGRHDIEIVCGVPENNNIAVFSKVYSVYVDLSPPTVLLTGPDSFNGPDTTCNLDGFTINVIMDDVDSSIASYEYTISGNGIVPNYYINASGNLNSIFVPPSGSALRNNESYIISVEAKDLAGNTGGSSITIRTFNPETGVTCDHTGPELTATTTYHTQSDKNFATVHISCTDPAVTSSPSSLSTGCLEYYRYSFMPRQDDCSGAGYWDSALYDEDLIFFDSNGTLCLQAKDQSANSVTKSIFINVDPIICGDGKIEQKLQPGYFGLTDKYNNWNWIAYDNVLDEECDGNNLNNNSCLTEGYVGGTLMCSPVTCTFDTSQCTVGQSVSIVKPQPFGIGNSSIYELVVHPDLNSECRYGTLASPYMLITDAFNSMPTTMIEIDATANLHSTNIGPLNAQGVYNEKYAVCNRDGNTDPVYYGITKVYEGYDASAPIIINVTTDKPGDRINDWNDRTIGVLVNTNEDTICTINDGFGRTATMYGDVDDFDSYSKASTAIIDYSELPNNPSNGQIALTVDCYNKAGLKTTAIKNIYYDIATQITIEKISPDEEYVSGYTATYAVQTNVLADCYISNGTENSFMIATDKYHEQTIGLAQGWNTIAVTCSDLSSHATNGYATYRIYGGANVPIGMTIDTSSLTCSLSSINAKLSATRTTLDIKSYPYTVTDLATSIVICSGTADNSGSLGCTASIVSGRTYIIEAYSLDVADHASDHAFAIITGSDSNDPACDVTAPIITITPVNTGYADIARLDITCTDVGSGCLPYYYYTIVGEGQSCANVPYELTRAYGEFDMTETGRICVTGSDYNYNYDYENASFTVQDYNFINIRPVSAQISPKFVPPKVIATLNKVTDIDFTTDIAAQCKFSMQTPTTNDTLTLYNSYVNFGSTGGTNHKISQLDIGSGEQDRFIDVICYASQFSSNPYSRSSFIISFVNGTPVINASLQPALINDWFDRTTQISALTNMDTVCEITTNDGQHDSLRLGTAQDSSTFANSHYAVMEYDVNTFTPSTYYYITKCYNYIGQSSEVTLRLDYDLPTTLNITRLSPLQYAAHDINIIATTNIVSNCTLYLDGNSLGDMSRDAEGQNHVIRATGLVDGTYNINISCAAAVRSITGSINYSVVIDTTIPATSCGDGTVQRPNDGGRIEDCDMQDLNGKTCTFGFVTSSYIGGQLRCKADCTYDFTNCDNGNGWCGNGELDGPNSNGLYEQCDGDVPSGLTCQKLGFKSGQLSCSNGCMINTSQCIPEGSSVTGNGAYTCNNNQLESNEQCEIGGNYSNIFCTTFGYDKGTVTCGSNCMFSMGSCGFNVRNTTTNNKDCGNGRKDSSEECDASASNDGLFSNQCRLVNANYTSGIVSCSNNCRYNFANCTGDGSTGGGSGSDAQCTNGAKDSTETDIDCGGSCDQCKVNKACIINADCESNRCSEGLCAVNTCNNGMLDSVAGETDIDCGGSSCDACEIDKTCNVGSDCESNACIDNKCAVDPCSNGLLDAGETDIDCGGSCIVCSGGQACLINDDCSSGLCEEGVCAGDLGVPEEPVNPAKFPLIIGGLVFMLGGGGYIIYRTFIEKKPPVRSGPMSFGPAHQVPQRPALSPEQQRAMLEKQREAIEKRRQQRASDRKGFLEKLEDKPAKSDKSEDTSKTDENDKKPKDKSDGDEEFVDITKLKSSKEKDKAELFGKLKEIGKDVDNAKIGSSKAAPETKEKNTLKMLGNLDRDMIMSKAFKEVLSKLLDSGKLSKQNVSNILFEYLDKGVITKADVARISSDMKIIDTK